jgi:hypothetical protein
MRHSFLLAVIIQLKMNHSPLNILIFGVEVKLAQSVSQRLRGKGIDTDSLGVSNTPERDAGIARTVSSKNWSDLIVGNGVRENSEWFERVKKIVNNVNSTISVVYNNGPNDVENAIERHFNVQLPLTGQGEISKQVFARNSPKS